MHEVHQNHHKNPRHIGIIITPILPVRAYEFCFILVLSLLLGQRYACGLNCGVVIGQLIMDTVHVLYHYVRFWWLDCGRFYHNHHHYRQEQVAHGLTR